ncbi:hypothetical protein [Pontibacter chitinilyticus]|uniref:hypothetical protein n=1 Tax=Pontibacter chitinilyticus TaxID=2674989 RepID=UPI0032196CCD
MRDLTLYDPFEKMQFTDAHCFLCGITITPTQRTPVFGEWLQHKYNLAAKELLLLDKSVTTYKALTIPCCNHCHLDHIIPLEQEVAAAAEKGLQGLQALPPKRLFQWICKMYYGILITELIKEMNPMIAPQYPLSEEPKMLGKFRELFKVLQSLRVPIKFADFLPCSLFLLEVAPEEDSVPFEYQDELRTMVFSIKLGATAVICTLLDNSIIYKALGKLQRVTEGKVLHPVQLAEFKACVFYAAYIFNVVPEYFIRPASPEEDHITYDTLIDDVTSAIFNPWEVLAYAHMLEEMLKPWSIREQDILKDPQQPLSFLIDKQQQFRNILHFEKSLYV